MKKVLRLMAVAIIALSGLCACNDCDCEPPYMDDPVEVAEKTKILNDYLQSHDEVIICINGEQHQYNPGSAVQFQYEILRFRNTEIRIDGQLIYFGSKIVLRVADFTHMISKMQDVALREILFFSTR